MEAKDKARELVEQYEHVQRQTDFEENIKSRAIKSALIAVNEILSLGYVPNEKSSFRVYQFYSEVKKEIEILAQLK